MTNSPTPPSTTSSTTSASTPTSGGLAERAAKMDLSATQIASGALAAMTAAALGSRLGVGGTLTGAALASIIAGVAGSLYTASLRHTQRKVATVLTSRKGAARPAASPVEGPGYASRTTAAPRAGGGRPPRFPWKTVLAAAVASFAVALVALTGLESLAGVALSGGKGTTVEQVTKQSNKQSDDKSSDKPTESSSPSAEPSESDSPPEDDSPTATDEPSSTDDQPEPDAEQSNDGGQSGAEQSGDAGQSGAEQSGDSGQSGDAGQSGDSGQSDDAGQSDKAGQ